MLSRTLQRLYITKFPSVVGRHTLRRTYISEHPYQGTNETVMIVDGDTNAPIGQASRQDYNDQALWCRKSFVFVQNPDGKYVVQVRSMLKEYYPGGVDLATGGIMQPDESNELNATRELAEELGIKRNEEDMKLIT